MRFLFKVATVFVCSLMLIAFLAACGVRTENDDKDSSNVSSTDNTSKEGNGVTDAVVSFGSVTEGTEGSGADDISSTNNTNSDTSSNNTSESQSSTGNDNDTSDTESNNETTSSGNSNSKVDYNDPDNWTDYV